MSTTFATKNLSEFEREFNDSGAIWSVNLNEAEFAELFKFCKEFEASEFKFLALPLGSKSAVYLLIVKSHKFKKESKKWKFGTTFITTLTQSPLASLALACYWYGAYVYFGPCFGARHGKVSR